MGVLLLSLSWVGASGLVGCARVNSRSGPTALALKYSFCPLGDI